MITEKQLTYAHFFEDYQKIFNNDKCDEWQGNCSHGNAGNLNICVFRNNR